MTYAVKMTVAPARERGLKFEDTIKPDLQVNVAPARERGLKFWRSPTVRKDQRRSREGAWIEMMMNINPVTQTSSSLPRGSVD